MKKWILLLAVVAVVIAAWLYGRTKRYTLPWNEPKFGQVTRGDIRVPITAPGLIEPKLRIEVKSKASGEVIETPVVEGDFVQAGDKLLELKKDDEERNFYRAQAELDRAQALLGQAQVSVEKADANILSAEARVEELAARAEMTKFDLKKIEEYREKKSESFSEQEYVNAKSQHEITLAQQKAARAARSSAHSALEEARQTVALQDAARRIASKTLEDAGERLEETTILAPQDAIVTEVLVRKGMLIQSGTTSLTGGTVVMLLADVSQKKVIARVDEADYGRVLEISPFDALPEMPGLRDAAQEGADRIAQRTGVVRLFVDAFPDLEFEGRIERVEPQGKLNQGSSVIQFDVHVEITDAKQQHVLPLGAQAQVEFTVESAKDVLRVPAEAVMEFERRKGVWILTPPEPGSEERYGKTFIPCRFGVTDGAYTEVVAPQEGAELTEGQQVYTKLPATPEREERG